MMDGEFPAINRRAIIKCSCGTTRRQNASQHPIARLKCFVQTHPLFITPAELPGQKWLEKRVKWWEGCTMSATIVREKRQTTLPADVVEAAGIKVNDQVDWRFEDGEIRGRKLVPVADEILELKDVDPKTFMPKNGGKVVPASIRAAIRADREGKR
jgi:bifunctional DNA-binding transcriptional regulator/antitoxin component of YhaV-PrlF toxin-antitoxin module